MPWVLLVIAGLLEIGFTTAMQFTKTATGWWPLVAFFVCVILSFYFLDRAAATIPLGTAYAVWTGIGAAGTVLVGILYFNEPATALRLVFLALLIGSIIGLKLVGNH